MVVTSGEKYFSCDALIIGAGLYGLYSAVRLAGRGLSDAQRRSIRPASTWATIIRAA